MDIIHDLQERVRKDFCCEVLYVVWEYCDVAFDMPRVGDALPVSIRDASLCDEAITGVERDKLLLDRRKTL